MLGTDLMQESLTGPFYWIFNANLIYPVSTQILTAIVWFLAAYTLGSIPVAWLLTKWITRSDLRQLGSGNIGVMNTAINVARWAGILVFIAEIVKGILAVSIPEYLHASEPIICLSIVGVVSGIRWPVWLDFKGGRGNTAGFAGLLLIAYPAPVIYLAIWILTRMLVKTSFMATRLSIISLPLVLWFSTHSIWMALTGLILTLFYLDAQHRESDDHLLLKEAYPSFWEFLISPPRRRY